MAQDMSMLGAVNPTPVEAVEGVMLREPATVREVLNTGTVTSTSVSIGMEPGEVTTISINLDVPNVDAPLTWIEQGPVGTISTEGRSMSPEFAPIADIRPQYDRVKGAKWFEKAQKNDVMILGQGGIGSWLTLLISRFGCPIYTYDMDTFEAHNMSGQLVRTEDIGKRKTSAVAEICRLFSGSIPIYPNAEFNMDSFAHHTMLSGFDNMNARKLAFHKWKEYLNEHIRRPSTGLRLLPEAFFFQDGRLTAEQFQIYNITGDRPDLIKKYEEEALFDEKEGYEGDCTFKQTSHCAAMVASHMVGFYTNWLTNVVTGDKNYAKLPFKFEHIIPFNLTMQDYANT